MLSRAPASLRAAATAPARSVRVVATCRRASRPGSAACTAVVAATCSLCIVAAFSVVNDAAAGAATPSWDEARGRLPGEVCPSEKWLGRRSVTPQLGELGSSGEPDGPTPGDVGRAALGDVGREALCLAGELPPQLVLGV